jgi:hypothetical protein
MTVFWFPLTKPGRNFAIIIGVALNIEWWVGPRPAIYATGLGYVEPKHIQIKHTVVNLLCFVDCASRYNRVKKR